MKQIQISYYLDPGSIQLLHGDVVTMDDINRIKQDCNLEYEGVETDWKTNKKYKVYHTPVYIVNGAWDLGKRYFVETEEDEKMKTIEELTEGSCTIYAKDIHGKIREFGGHYSEKHQCVFMAICSTYEIIGYQQ